MKNKILDILNNYGEYLYIEDMIPNKKLENAILHYPVDRSDTILALIDTTAFGSAKTGMVIGVKGIYFRNDWTTETVKNFLSWEELSNGNKIKKGSIWCVLLANKCEFNVSGGDISREIVISLLNNIIDLYSNYNVQDNALHNLNKQDDDPYSQVVSELIALCIVADSTIEDSEIEMANLIIENDDLIKNKNNAIKELGDKIEELLAIKEKSHIAFKLKSTSIISNVSKITDKLKQEKILIVLEGMFESVQEDKKGSTKLLIDSIREKI